MKVTFNTTERATVDYIQPEFVEAWLEKNGWKVDPPAVYWKIWRDGIYWVQTPGKMVELSEANLIARQSEMFERLQNFLDRPAIGIWYEMFALQEESKDGKA